MKKIAKFEKVSLSQFLKNGTEIIYNDIILPRRATTGSAGYDFFAPTDIDVKSGETVLVPTGIRVKIDEGWVLKIYPRSGLGFKFRLTLNNTVGIIDSDYYFAENEGHIFIKMTNLGEKDLFIEIIKNCFSTYDFKRYKSSICEKVVFMNENMMWV